MSRIIYIIAFLCCSSSIFAQITKVVSVGYVETYDSLPKISFLKSSPHEFEKIKPKDQLFNLPLIPSKTHHILKTRGKVFKLKKYKDYGGKETYNGYGYVGYYPKLKMYALTDHSTSENIGFGTMVLIDSATAYQYQIISIGDDAVETPILSPNGDYIVYFYNWIYDDNSCFVGLLKVGDSKHPQKLLKEKASFETKDWGVEKIKWTNDQTFVVKAFVIDKSNGGTKSYRYFKSRIE